LLKNGEKKLSLKSVYLNTNQILQTKCKKKIDELKKLGVGVLL